MSDYTTEELQTINAKQSRIIKELEADEKHYIDTIKVYKETVSLLMKPTADAKALTRCIKWLSESAISVGEEGETEKLSLMPTVREFTGLPIRKGGNNASKT